MKLELQQLSKTHWEPKSEPININGGKSQIYETKKKEYIIELQTFHIGKDLRSVSFTFVSPFKGLRDIKTSDLITANRLLQQIDEFSEIHETNA